MEKEFIVRCYRKSELAALYFPGMEPKTGVQKMRRWIGRCKPLAQELEQAHCDRLRKELTAREVRLIVRYLGEP